MSKPGGAIAGSDAAQRAGDGYAQVRGADDIQYATIPIPKNPPLDRTPTEPPEWLKAIGRFFEAIGNALQAIFEPVGRLIGISWPVMQWVLIAVGGALLLFLLFRLLSPLFASRRTKAEVAELDWEPGREQAIALLDEADRLAAAGDYEEATHLLLQRSVAHIETARPGLLPPASTAREIALHPGLPDRARKAFAAISVRVERSLFALRNLDLGDWQVARAAYADFALARLDEGAEG